VAVALAPDGARVVLNNWNPYPLLRQDGDGAYTQRLVNPHYDMSLAHSLAYDPAGRLLVSGFGQSPFGRHAIRVYDAGLRPLTAFGDEGAAPGQFDAPAGVASWGQTCTYGGPYQADAHTLLLLHLDGSYAGAQGQAGTPNGAGFAAGRYGQGVLLDEGDTLTYRTAGNLNLTEGAIEFWLRPDWDGNDKQDYAFFEVGNDWFNRIRIAKDGGNHLRIVVWDSSAEYGAGHLVDDWKAGEWRHIGVTWQEGIVALYEDGVQVDRQPARFPDWLAEPMYVGSGSWDGRVANGVIDEFRISSAPRLGNSDSCSRILVADSGNHRVQAFDSLGRFVSAFGAFGSGPGQFDNPQGLVVHSSGRVIVADSGNDRLQLLSFDGARFGFLRSITAGFNRPTGLAADSRGNVAVADTGNNRVVLFSADGKLLDEYNQPNDGYTGTFNAPRGVAIEPDGDLVVADTGNSRVVAVRGALAGARKLWLPLVRSASS
jgi:DNA-binding beta-propeller fold protein YncE